MACALARVIFFSYLCSHKKTIDYNINIMRKIYSFVMAFVASVAFLYADETTEPVVDPSEYDILYEWNGKRTEERPATEAVENGGFAEVYGGNTNIVVGAAQKTNCVMKLGKGFDNGINYIGISLDNPIKEGDVIQLAAFRTATTAVVFGMDFSADDATATIDNQILIDNLQIVSTNVAPVDEYFTVPDGVANAKFVRLYRNNGSASVHVANFTILRQKTNPEGIEDITEDQSPAIRKVIEDGQLLILKGDKAFNMNGQIVK